MSISTYIKENLAKGHSLDKIKKYLLVHGHSEKSINKAIEEVNLDYEEGNIL